MKKLFLGVVSVLVLTSILSGCASKCEPAPQHASVDLRWDGVQANATEINARLVEEGWRSDLNESFHLSRDPIIFRLYRDVNGTAFNLSLLLPQGQGEAAAFLEASVIVRYHAEAEAALADVDNGIERLLSRHFGAEADRSVKAGFPCGEI